MVPFDAPGPAPDKAADGSLDQVAFQSNALFPQSRSSGFRTKVHADRKHANPRWADCSWAEHQKACTCLRWLPLLLPCAACRCRPLLGLCILVICKHVVIGESLLAVRGCLTRKQILQRSKHRSCQVAGSTANGDLAVQIAGSKCKASTRTFPCCAHSCRAPQGHLMLSYRPPLSCPS